MVNKIKDYKGVIFFYLLLVLLLIAVNYQNKIIDMQQRDNPITFEGN